MGRPSGPYQADCPLGTTVRVASRTDRDAFLAKREWHHPLQPDQLLFAGQIAQVINVAFYDGGDELYTLEGVPGL